MTNDPTATDWNGTEIAIVGMAARLPGADDVDAYWRNLRDGVESIRRLSDDELRAAGVDPALLADPNYVKSNGELSGIPMFDAGFFGFSPKDAGILDPQHRHLLELCWTALEHAGHTSKRFPGAIGVFAGCGMNSYFVWNVLGNADLVRSTGLFLLRHTGNDRDFLPTTISYKLNLRGPSLAIQTACSTSLVAVHVASQSLLNRECDMALAGGVTINLQPGQGYLYRENEVQAPDGHCRAFDAAAAGTVLTSGAGVVVLRRLADAIEDGDTIHAVIRGSAINNDGSGKVGYLAPSVDGHAQVVAEALAVAGLTADDVSYIEAHGTGTRIGDPIEIAALTQGFASSTQRKGFCRIGSVKTNIGHLDTAAGVASLIKVVQALKHRQLPPTLNFRSPNPGIDFAATPFVVNSQLTDWKADGPRRAGISSLGVGGTNAHVVVEEAPAPIASEASRPYEILTLSAKTPTALDTATTNLANWFEANPGAHLGDVAYTLQVGREAFEHRRVVVASDAADAVAALRAKDGKRVFGARPHRAPASVAFLFPGGGAQYPDMGREIYEQEPVYRQEVDRCLQIVRAQNGVDLKPLMFPTPEQRDAAAAQLERPFESLCSVVVTEYALAKLWQSYGVVPTAMIGHSLGEYTVACLAGVLSLEDMLTVVALRGRLIERALPGAMLSVPLPEDVVARRIGDALDLAVVNGPSLCVVSGPLAAIDALAAELASEGIDAKKLRVAAPGHSRLLDPILDAFREGLAKVTFRPPQQRYVSNVTGDWVDPNNAVDREYWVTHLRRTVRFAQGLTTLAKDPDRILLEVGPGQTLSSLARQHGTKPVAVLASLRHQDDRTSDMRYLLSTFARMWLHGFDVDFARARHGARRRRITLPTYPFEHQPYWIAQAARNAGATDASAEPLALTKAPTLDDWFWRRRLVPRDGTPPPREKRRERWLVFGDAGGLGVELRRRLVEAGDEVSMVREGDAFYALKNGEYALSPESGVDGYRELIADLQQNDRLPTRILHLWLVTQTESFRPGSSFFHRNMERGFYSLMFLAQALGDVDGIDVDVTVVGNGMQSVDGEPLPYPEKTAALGPVRVVPREFDGIRCRLLDVVLPPTDAKAKPFDGLATALLTELRTDATEPVAVLRGDRWHVESYGRAQPTPLANGRTRLRERGVYVVTGGLGGIGIELAEHLGRTVQARVVLIGRRGLPAREAFDEWLASHDPRDQTCRTIRKIRAIEAAGGEVMVAAGDVANPVRMREVVDEAVRRFGAIHGLFHAAGTIEDGVVLSKTQENVERVFTPKIHGTMVLDEVLAGQNLDFVVLFASTSAILGPAGQVDYTAANCFLEAFADARHGGRTPTFAIDWGVWKTVGMSIGIRDRLQGRPPEPRRVEAARHPLLGDRLATTDGTTQFVKTWAVHEQWLLDEHRAPNGQPLVPGTGYLELARGAFAELHQDEPVEIRDVTFVAPLAVGESAPRDVRVTLTPEGEDQVFVVESRATAEADGWMLHAQATLRIDRSKTPPRIPLDAMLARCPRRQDGAGGTLKTEQAKRIRFGPRFDVVRSLAYGTDEAIAVVELPAAFHGDLTTLPLHPAMLDLATGFPLPLLPGYDAAPTLYVPLGYRRVRVRGPLPTRVHALAKSRSGNRADRETATFDVLLTDDAGEVVVEVEGFTVRRIGDATAFAAPGDGEVHGVKPATIDQPGHAGHPSAGERLFLETYEAGILPQEGMSALDVILRSDAASRVVVCPVDLAAWSERARQTRQEQTTGVRFDRPNLQSAYEAPRDDVERTLAGFWEDLLGVDKIGIRDDFFELGGHSLIAVRLFARIKKAYDVEFPLSVLFDAPTIAGCAELLRSELGLSLQADGESAKDAPRKPKGPRFRFLVPMNDVAPNEKPPFFLVAGMFGNVLNLRHLAAHLGRDQKVYAIQARGLLGDDKPHRRFEDMARDYLTEIRQVQPNGPYFLGGFSGGGITALEIAHQLRDVGEQIGILVMLDSIPAKMPGLSAADKVRDHLHRLRTEGLRYVTRWARNRWNWEKRRLQQRMQKTVKELTPAEFRSEEIEAAFREALTHYDARPYPGVVDLFRPPLDQFLVLSEGRVLNRHREFVDHFNHWAPLVTGEILVHVVTGTHDSMVLEPHVRVLAETLRRRLAEAQRNVRVVRDVEPVMA